MSSDPFLLAGGKIIGDLIDELLAAPKSLSAEGLNWRPVAQETNSIAVLITHALHSTRSWLCVALGLPQPPRDRESEFVVRAKDLDAFWSDSSAVGHYCREALASVSTVDWKALGRQTGSDEEVTAAWALLHAAEHLREHVAQVGLTLQLFMAREAPS